MEVKDMIEQLKSLPADALILVQGYEDGFDEIVAVKEVPVVKRPDPYHWEGQYEGAEKDRNDAITAAVIFGNRR